MTAVPPPSPGHDPGHGEIRTTVEPAGDCGVFDAFDPPSAELIADCVHCGFCLPTCPTYALWGVEMDSPRGRIWLMKAGLEGAVEMDRTFVEHFDRCLGCMACVTACPSGVQYDELIAATRAQIERGFTRSPRERLLRGLIFSLFPYPRRLRVAGLLGWLYQRLGIGRLLRRTGLFARLPAEVQALESLLPGISPRRLRQRRDEQARAFARETIAVFEAAGVDTVVVNAAGCGSTLKEYGRLLAGDPVWAPRAAALAAKARDIMELLDELGPVAPRHPIVARVAYHDACHLAHAQQIRAQPREQLTAIPGLELLEIAESEICCGSAGIYNLVLPEPAAELGLRKAANIAALRPDAIATANPGCLLQLRRHLGADIPLLHPVQLVDASLRGLDPLSAAGGA